ncbi:esterase/lipase family protein [Streptomyces sp. NPDC001843]|uniref:esterase/lipase family protein n=1 Tax=Streptomyces sp. NPDC001843 TaxID=3364617 RepID=UPI0036C79F38
MNDVSVNRPAGGDIAVIVPGILGSTLVRGDRRVWGYRQVFRSVHRLGSRLTQDLSLPAAAFADPSAGHDDGVRADGSLKSLAIIPGFVAMDGYDRLVGALRKRFTGDLESVHEFCYDWRQSNEYSAERLRDFVQKLLRRRRATVPDARVVLIGHSMGGLVARFYAECLDEQRDVRRVVTIGTPFRGSVKALTVLANGFVRLGPVKFSLGELARSLPSVAELLPMYDCLGSSPDRLGPLTDGTGASAVPGLPAVALARSRDFHQRMERAVAANGDDRPTYHTLLSHWQTTDLWALVDDNGETRAQPSKGYENGGDGTVPRCSASPPEWADDAGAVFIAGKHAALQQQRETLVQLRGVLTARPRQAQAMLDGVSVEASPYAEVGEEWRVTASSVEGSDGLPLVLTVVDPEDAVERPPLVEHLMRPTGRGSYTAVVRLPRGGLFRWTVATPLTAANPVDPVSDVVFCAEEA